jgi:hypothetical protein
MSDQISAIERLKLRKRPTRVLPTDRMAFQRQLDVLRAYAINGEGGKAVTNEQVATTVKIVPGTVSLCNPFLADVQLILRADGGYMPSPEVIAFNHALGWDSETATHKLAPVLRRTWFADALIPKVRFRPIEEREAMTVLAEASVADRDHEAQLRMLLEYLAASGLIIRDGGMVRVGSTLLAAPLPTTAQLDKQEVTPSRKPEQELSSDRVMPIPLGRGRLARVELPEDWDSAKDLDRFLKMLRLSLAEGPEEPE